MGWIEDLTNVSWDKFWKTLIQTLQESVDSIVDVLAPALENIVPIVVGFGIQTFVDVTANAGRAMGTAIDEYESDSGIMLIEAAAAGLSDLFGIPISTASIGLRGGTNARREMSNRLGQLVMEQMYANLATVGELTPDKGREAAERLVGFSMSTAIEGWLSGLLTQSVLTKWLPNWGDLEGIVADNLGLGSASTKAMAPIVKATVETPFEWDVNRRYTPAILRRDEAVKAWIQGTLTEDEFFELEARHGYDRETAASLKLLKGRFPFKEDIARMRRLGMYQSEDMVQALRERGFLPEASVMLGEMYERLGEDSANQRTVTVAADMFRDGEIEDAEFRNIMEQVGLAPTEIEARMGLGLLERSRPRQLPRSIIERAFQGDIVSGDRLRSYYRTQGFTEEDAGVLMELQIAKKEVEGKPLPRGVIERAYIEGHVPKARLSRYYEAAGFSAEDIEVALDVVETKRKAFVKRERAETPFGRGLN